MTVQVDLNDLAEAFADATARLEYFVDRKTGEVMLVSDTLGFIEAEQQRLAMADDPARYLAVPLATPGDDIEDLEVFVETVADPSTKARLDALLDAEDPIKQLDRALARNDELTQRWGDHRSRRALARAARWLTEQGLTAA